MRSFLLLTIQFAYLFCLKCCWSFSLQFFLLIAAVVSFHLFGFVRKCALVCVCVSPPPLSVLFSSSTTCAPHHKQKKHKLFSTTTKKKHVIMRNRSEQSCDLLCAWLLIPASFLFFL
uniref:(northern house mosquito) hypothetical protein n=1 Tax=Culex pipiens TaxID=7175 RepID=A0A8D8KHJ8_CULPI